LREDTSVAASEHSVKVPGTLTFDLVIRGGHGVDGARLDVGMDGGLVAALDADIPADAGREVLDATGLLVLPGLVDLHTHVFFGQDLGVDADTHALAAGTTTAIDAGSAGAHLFGAFEASSIRPSRERILAYLNISTIGTTSILLAGELENLAYCSVDACVECVEANRDVLIGVKVRASGNVVGESGLEPVVRARHAAERLDTPMMVHIGPSPPPLGDIVDQMRPGDVLTHAFNGWDNRLLDPWGKPRPEAWALKDAGVVLDVGHGMAGFDAEVAAALIEAGVTPDTISTDIHAYSAPYVVDLPTTMSKLMALGMSLPDVVAAATEHPAAAIGRKGELGVLRAGGAADLALLELERGTFRFEDSPPIGTERHSFEGHERLVCRATVRGGVVV
jgi:dihydroorotase